MLQGKQSWVFQNHPVIKSTGVSGGPFEANGRLAADFDVLHDDLWMGKTSYEQAHRILLEEAAQTAMKKGELKREDIQFFLAGDLINQITPSSFAARDLQIPYFGLFGACSTSMEGLALASFMVNYQGANNVLTGASSHNAAVEKQFRYPTEYGGQKPPTAQWTVTGAGVALITKNQSDERLPYTTSATIGKVVDMGLADPFNMGGAMAPAAADTILAHFQDLQLDPSYYDLIVTGDLGKIGRETVIALLKEKGLTIDEKIMKDCGLLIYTNDQPVQSGGSGAGCSATVMYGHLLNEMKKGMYKRILCVATGALLSPLTVQQGETIPCIAHAVSIEI
ncbi:stage V sporulation protein AD [Niallia circulans]|jgi:stage V sporulation protein AD|uniref:stage V sporulation protein AD n=1 Tax=Niallia TaxID=2837506 RepID=UPI00077CA832|nr:stage V sporulation protein AD [Niallia circulans]MCM2982607.1 stage V sporulation protein AD [Niallia circulans]MDR4316116.1 stage V sporulation protein AD [Niallia circulans]MED3837545.1 stage V sporulation protein AD [Niallia circulans]MED4244615.1 stage V sporulation protein AD [Niallia circulans]MED4249901.1 stage V sporulation protein AD [Niallia circulans]